LPKTPPKKRSEAHARLAARIADAGPVSVADFIAEACAHYYATRDPLGAAGDFTTAPEISQMFGEMIAACLADAWMQAGGPPEVRLIELGPGRGTLSADILRTFHNWPVLAGAVHLHLVETSPALRARQAAALAGHDNVFWHDRIEDVPPGFSLIVANEFFDALPVRQFEKKDGAWRERAVGHDAEKDAFFFTTLPAPDADIPAALADEDDGAIYETSPASIAVMKTLAARLAAQDGLALVIDYGYEGPAAGDTLQSLRHHTFTNVLEDVGEQDVTAHVDFTALKAAAESAGAAAHGPVTQHGFLGVLGIAARAQALALKATPKQRRDIELALYRLTAPSEMGTLFRVLGLTARDGKIHPAGFATAEGET